VTDKPQRHALRHTEDAAMLLTDDNFDDVIAWVKSTGAEVTWRGYRNDDAGTRAFEISNAYRPGQRWGPLDTYVTAAVGAYVVLGGDGWFTVQSVDEFDFRHGVIIDGHAGRPAIDASAE